jgi:hypothetical protein
MRALSFAKIDGCPEVLVPTVDAEDTYDGFDIHLAALLLDWGKCIPSEGHVFDACQNPKSIGENQRTFQVRSGENVTIGHNATVHGCSIGAASLIGIGATVLNGAVAAGALIRENMVIRRLPGSPSSTPNDLHEVDSGRSAATTPTVNRCPNNVQRPATNFAWRLDDYLQAIPLHFSSKSANMLKSSEPSSKQSLGG